MKLKLKQAILIAVVTLTSAGTSLAALINDMQSCQGTLNAIDRLLEETTIDYPADDVKVIREGFKQYNNYIQQEIITPGLLKFSHGDVNKAAEMQTQVDSYKSNIVNAFKKRYHENRLYMDHAVLINECTKKSVPSGESLNRLIAAFKMLEKLTQIQ